MKFLVFAVYQKHSEIFTSSKEMDFGNKIVKNSVEEITEFICKDGIDKEYMFELFVWKSAKKSGDAPELVGYWNQEDGWFGKQEDD